MSSQALGINPGHWYERPEFRPGTEGSTGVSDYVFTQALARTSYGDVLVADTLNRAVRLTSASARAEAAVGVCETDGPVEPGGWFWMLRRGPARFQAAADCAAAVTLFPTAVPGVVDDDAGTYAIEGLVSGDAAGAGGIVSGRITWASLRAGRGGGGGGGISDVSEVLDQFKDPRTNDDRGGYLRVDGANRDAGQITQLPDATTTVKGVVRLADDGEADAGTALEVMDAAQTKRVLEERTPAATESRMGLVEFADTAEADTGVQWRGMDAAQTKRRIEAAIAAIPTGGGSTGTPPAGVLAKSNPAADVVTPGAAAINNWGAWTDIVSTPAVTAEQSGLLEVFTTGHGVVSAYPGAPALAGGGDRVQTHLRIRRTRGADTTTILDQDIYGPRNLTLANNAMYSAATRVQDFDFAIPENAQVGDVYTLQIRIITQTANRRQVSWGKDETCLILFRPAAAEPLETTSFYNRVNSTRQYSIDSGTNAGDWGLFTNTIESMEATAETAGRSQIYLQVKLDATYLSGAALGGDDDAIITHLACSIQGPAPASAYIRGSLDQELYGPRNNQGASSTGFRDASDRLTLAYTIPVDLEVGQKFRIAFRCMAQKGRRRLTTDLSNTWLVHYRIGGGGGGSGGGGTGGLDKEAVEDAAAGLLTKGDDAATADIAATYDDPDASVALTVKADRVTPAQAKFKTGTRAADKWVKIDSTGLLFEGADAPAGSGGGGGLELTKLVTVNLPTAVQADNALISETQTFAASGERGDFPINSAANSVIEIGSRAPANAIGFMAVTKFGPTEQARYFFPYPYANPGQSGMTTNEINVFPGQARMKLRWTRPGGTDAFAVRLTLRGAGTSFLSGSTFELHGVKVGAGSGDGGMTGGSTLLPDQIPRLGTNALLSVALPDAATSPDSSIRNLNGVLYERVATDTDPSVVSGVAAARTSPFVGGPIVEWDAPPSIGDTIRAHFPSTAPGMTPNPPTRVWLSFGDERHFHTDAVLERDTGLDAAGTLGYSDADGIAIDTPAGDKYRAQFYLVAGGPTQGAELAVHPAASARWELADRDLEARIQQSVPPIPTGADYGQFAEATAEGPKWGRPKIDATNLNVPTAAGKQAFRDGIGAVGGSGLLRWWTRNAAGGLTNAHMVAPSATIVPTKIAVDGAFFYVYDSAAMIVRCYNRMTGAAVPLKNLSTAELTARIGAAPQIGGLTANGGLLYAVDAGADVVAVWTVGAVNAALVYNAGQSIASTVLLSGGVSALTARGIATDGDTLWIADGASDAIYAYDISVSPAVRLAGSDVTAAQVRAVNADAEIQGLAYSEGGLWFADRDDHSVRYVAAGTGTRDRSRDVVPNEIEDGITGTANIYGMAYDPQDGRLFLAYTEQKFIRAWDHNSSAVQDSFPGVNALPVHPNVGQGFTALGGIRVPGRGILVPGTGSGVRGYFAQSDPTPDIGTLTDAPQNGVEGLYYATGGPDMGKVLFLRNETHYNKTAHQLRVLPRGAGGFESYTFGAGTTPNSRAATGVPGDIFSVPSAVQIIATDGSQLYPDWMMINGRRYQWDGLNFDLLQVGTENLRALITEIIQEQVGALFTTHEDRWFNLTVNSSLLNTQGGLELFQTPYQLGVADAGTILTVVMFRVSAGSTSQMSLGEQNVQQTDLTLLQPLRSTQAYLAGFSTLYGELIAGVDVLPVTGGVVGSNRIGRVDIRLAHDAGFNTGHYATFTREESTGTSVPGVIQYHLRSILLRTG